MHTINPVVFQSEEGLVISGSPDDLMRLAEVLMLVAKHPKTVHITLTDSFANKIIIDPTPSQIEITKTESPLSAFPFRGESMPARPCFSVK